MLKNCFRGRESVRGERRIRNLQPALEGRKAFSEVFQQSHMFSGSSSGSSSGGSKCNSTLEGLFRNATSEDIGAVHEIETLCRVGLFKGHWFQWGALLVPPARFRQYVFRLGLWKHRFVRIDRYLCRFQLSLDLGTQSEMGFDNASGLSLGDLALSRPNR